MYRVLLVAILLMPICAVALVDPTQPSSFRAVKKQATLRLESILYSETRKVAVINGNVVAEGDNIGSTKIILISKDSVKVSRGGNQSILKLNRTSIRQEN